MASKTRGKTTDLRFPSEVTPGRRPFDVFADRVMRFISSSTFFTMLTIGIVASILVGYWIGYSEVWVAAVNTVGTFIVLFCIVILQTTTRQSDLATQHKLNALALALLREVDEVDREKVRRELDEAIGVEAHETASGIDR